MFALRKDHQRLAHKGRRFSWIQPPEYVLFEEHGGGKEEEWTKGGLVICIVYIYQMYINMYIYYVYIHQVSYMYYVYIRCILTYIKQTYIRVRPFLNFLKIIISGLCIFHSGRDEHKKARLFQWPGNHLDILIRLANFKKSLKDIWRKNEFSCAMKIHTKCM